jgi:ribosomal protein S27AE
MSMTFHPIRKACPACGKPMKLVVADEKHRVRYVCTNCEGIDPLRNPAVRRWAESPLRPPGK